MSYQTKLDEITDKLNRLKSGGGQTRPLVLADNGAAAAAQAKKYEDLLDLIGEIKAQLKENGRQDSERLLGHPNQSSIISRAEILLTSIIKPNLADTVNALFDFCYRFDGIGASDNIVQRFNKLVAEIFKEKCMPSDLLRLNDKTKLTLKKRRQLEKFVEIYGEFTSGNLNKKLPELLILKNELEGYLNEKENEKIASQLDDKEIGNSFKDFFALRISDILPQPVLSIRADSQNEKTIFGLLDSTLNELFEIRAENNLFRSETLAALNEIKRETKNLASVCEKTLREIKILKGGGESEESYGDILDELSALKDDIKSALAFEITRNE